MVAAVIVAVPGAVAAAHLVTVGADCAAAAHDQAAQQPGARLGPAGVPLAVVAADPLDGLEDVVGDDAWHRDRDPLGGWAGPLAGWAPARGRGRDQLGAVVVGTPDVGLVAQQPPDGRHPPHRLAGWRSNAVGVEPPGELPHGQACGHVVVEDAPDHLRFGLVDLKVRGASRPAGHPPVAVGRLPADDLADTRAPQLATPVALGDLGTLVLGDHPLDLGEQPDLRVVIQGRGIHEPHRHPSRPSSSSTTTCQA